MTPEWEIARPGATRLPGLRMAAFTARATTPVELPILPFPSLTLFVDLGDAAVLDATGEQAITGSGFIGIGAEGLTGRARHLECLQLRLAPPLAYAVLGGAAHDLSTAAADASSVWGPGADRMRELLGAQRNSADRFALLETELIRRSSDRPRVDPEVAEVWRELSVAHGAVRVEQLAADVGWSRKRLWTRFRAQLGITPKRAASLIRFDHAAHLLATGRSPALAAADSGYADQSHLHRDTTTFAGLTPVEVANAPWLQADPVAWPRAG